MNTRFISIVLTAAASLGACAHVTPPPEPDMSKLIPANKTTPEEVQGRVQPQPVSPMGEATQ